MSSSADGVHAALNGIVSVSRETAERLEAYVAVLTKWQRAENLVSADTLPNVWRRHVADSAQLVTLFPEARQWVDLGSGAGLPGLVVAIVGPPDTHVHLVESNRRKCAFLRQAIRATAASAEVHEGRIESVLDSFGAPVDRICSRALAPLAQLLALAAPVMERGVPAAFHKGEDYAREIEAATLSWSFDLVKHANRIGGKGVILGISNLSRRSNDR